MSGPDGGRAYRSERPEERLTRIGSAMAGALHAHPENPGDDVRAVILLHDATRGGITVSGYEGDEASAAAIADVILHLKAMFEANGKTFMIMTDPMGTGPN